MRDDIKASASRLHALLHQSVVEIAPQVRALVDNGSRDERLIEHTLDRLLDSACIPEGLALFKMLCRHYWYINPGAAAVYVDTKRINRVSCGIGLIMALPEPAMGCVASA